MTHSEYCSRYASQAAPLLDVGSREGDLLLSMARRGYHTIGIERNPEYVRRSLQKIGSHTYRQCQKPVVHMAMAENLPIASKTIGFVNCSEVTEHVDDPLLVCREIYRVLRPGGYAYISFHNRYSIYDYHYRVYGINWMPRPWADTLLNLLGKSKENGDSGLHTLAAMHYYTYAQVTSMLDSIGYQISDCREDHIVRLCGRWAVYVVPLYRYVARPLYYSTFHLLVWKQVL